MCQCVYVSVCVSVSVCAYMCKWMYAHVLVYCMCMCQFVHVDMCMSVCVCCVNECVHQELLFSILSGPQLRDFHSMPSTESQCTF